MIVEKLDDTGKRVLQALSSGRVMSGSQLVRAVLPSDENAVREAVQKLATQGLVSYKGDLNGDAFPDAYITVQPSARDASEFLANY
jgi:Mn-dependent DtxR family transcriptional regulator